MRHLAILWFVHCPISAVVTAAGKLMITLLDEVRESLGVLERLKMHITVKLEKWSILYFQKIILQLIANYKKNRIYMGI